MCTTLRHSFTKLSSVQRSQRVSLYTPIKYARLTRTAHVKTFATTASGASNAQYGIFVCSASPTIAEALCHSGVDWICLDGQHGPVDYSTLSNLLTATAGGKAKRIVRVGGPQDRFGVQQALE
eukprot:jgi/Chrzof1/5015/Cz15g08180.t1